MGDGRWETDGAIRNSVPHLSPAPFSPLTSPISLLSYHHLPCVECSASPSIAFHRARDALDSAPPPSVHSARINNTDSLIGALKIDLTPLLVDLG